jgi:hypothetical protein
MVIKVTIVCCNIFHTLKEYFYQKEQASHKNSFISNSLRIVSKKESQARYKFSKDHAMPILVEPHCTVFWTMKTKQYWYWIMEKWRVGNELQRRKMPFPRVFYPKLHTYYLKYYMSIYHYIVLEATRVGFEKFAIIKLNLK